MFHGETCFYFPGFELQIDKALAFGITQQPQNDAPAFRPVLCRPQHHGLPHWGQEEMALFEPKGEHHRAERQGEGDAVVQLEPSPRTSMAKTGRGRGD
jgi:hypothetical protein